MSGSNEISVWDPLIRCFHWLLVASFLTVIVTEDDLMILHTWAGYLVLFLVVFRWVWGFAGSRHARFSDFVRSPKIVMAYLLDVLAFRAGRHIGHNPAGGAMVLALLVVLPLTALSGMAVYGISEYSGPFAGLLRDVPIHWSEAAEEIHEFLANSALLLVVLHLAGVVVAGLQHRENLVRAMWTGKKRT